MHVCVVLFCKCDVGNCSLSSGVMKSREILGNFAGEWGVGSGQHLLLL